MFLTHCVTNVFNWEKLYRIFNQIVFHWKRTFKRQKSELFGFSVSRHSFRICCYFFFGLLSFLGVARWWLRYPPFSEWGNRLFTLLRSHLWMPHPRPWKFPPKLKSTGNPASRKSPACSGAQARFSGFSPLCVF